MWQKELGRWYLLGLFVLFFKMSHMNKICSFSQGKMALEKEELVLILLFSESHPPGLGSVLTALLPLLAQ